MKINRSNIFGFLIIFISISGWLFLLIPSYFKNIEIKKIEDEFRSLTIYDIKSIIFKFNEKYNDGIEEVFNEKDKVLFLNIIMNLKEFKPNHPETLYIGNINILTYENKIYNFNVYYEKNKKYSFISWKFGKYGSYKSAIFDRWIINRVIQISMD